MYYPDLAPENPFFSVAPQLWMVGWLERGYDYSRGPVAPEFADRLVELLLNPWQPVCAGGWHDCDLCRLSCGRRELTYKDKTIHMGVSNLYVPGAGIVFCAPSLIAHYIYAHEYVPPREFCEAVLACPPMRSPAYFRALLANGMRGLTKGAI